LRLPPLRERLEDIGDLAQHFFVLAAAEGLPLKRIEPDALERLKRYRWPGNIRELENLTRRLAALYPQEAVTAQLVDMELGADAPGTGPHYPVALDQEKRSRSPDLAGDRLSVDFRGACRGPRQSDQGRRTVGAEPEYIAQEGPRSRHQVDPFAALGDIAAASQCHRPLGFPIIFSKKICGRCSLKPMRP
jgi:DNA-binding NtrC family response regulator